jgi:sporulation protein YlmC with PRC-barrel domain
MLINRPVLSLRINRQVATTLSAIINPDNLKIEGFYCQDNQTRKQLILVSQDIRDVLSQGLVVNDQDVLSEPGDLVRLEKLLQLNFQLIGKAVETTSKQKIGKVSDYAVEVQTLYIQKLYVSQSVFRSFSGGNLGVDRSQIVEITDKRIVINDLEAKVPVGARAVA